MLKQVEPGKVRITPLELLEIILKSVLDERITDEEVERICVVYRETVTSWYGAAQ